MNIFYTNKLPSAEDFLDLYRTTGWDKDDPVSHDLLYKSISNSWYVIFAYDENKLIGCGRVISDGYMHAYINEMIVDPSYQGLGIGKQIINNLLDKILSCKITDIQLFCAIGKKEFYLKNGFVERFDNAPGMQYKIN